MSDWSKIKVRGQTAEGGAKEVWARSAAVTLAWGSQPSEGALTYVAQADWPMFEVDQEIEVTLFGTTYYGIVQSGPRRVSDGSGAPNLSSGGNEIELRWLDRRTLLKKDRVFCAFNVPDVRLVNGVRVKRYSHLLPQHWQRWEWTWTDGPLSAAVIISRILRFNTVNYARGTVKTLWATAFHPDQTRVGTNGWAFYPVYNIDAQSGRGLDDVLQEISDALGMTFTLVARNTLQWVRKGEGIAPSVPGAQVDQLGYGITVSGHPTRILVVGDRNLYLLLNLRLQYDWNRNWEEFFDLEILADDLFRNETDSVTGQPFNAIPNDVEEARGRQLAGARAREITVGEYAALRAARDGVVFKDYRRFGGRSRMEMPAAIYIQQILFRAFRPPSAVPLPWYDNATQRWKFESVPLAAVNISDELVARITHNPVTGLMSATLQDVHGGNGYAVAKGYRIGQELFLAIQPERFNLQDFVDSTGLWQSLSFQLDESGEDGRFLLFDEPVIKADGLMRIVNGLAVLEAAPRFQVPEVMASLVIEADRFFYPVGSGTRDEVATVTGLRGEYMVDAASGAVTEVPYLDGKLSGAKAMEIGAALLNRPAWYYHGSYEFKLKEGDAVPALTGALDRITVESSEGGYIYRVHFASERVLRSYTPERDLERRVRMQSLVPGQAELKDQARLMRLLAAGFKQMPELIRKAADFLRMRMGADEALYPILIESGSGLLEVGAPLWKAPTEQGTQEVAGVQEIVMRNTRAVLPAAVAAAHRQFAGVTVRQGEDASKPLKVQRTGQLLVRVMGPVDAGDSLVRALGQDYLKKGTGGGEPMAGQAEQSIPVAEVRLIEVTAGTGTGDTSGRRAVWG